ncbi:MAG: sulfatase, partial [bacterium]|nr:sulfatase [bacterium]
MHRESLDPAKTRQGHQRGLTVLRFISSPWCRWICVAMLAGWLGLSFSNANAAERPNVILFIADDVSWNDYGCYGNDYARTPRIDALAKSGIRFDRAYLTASSCSPSRASIVTGRYPHNNGKAAELHLPIAANLPWFPELLRDSGYHTALSGKNHMQVDDELGNDPDAPRGQAFDLIDGGRAPGNSGGHANWVKLVRQRPKDRPFFFWFAAYDAHRAWDADSEWDAEKYGPPHDPESVQVPPFLIDDLETRRDLASYYNEVTRFDYYIGQVVDELQQQGVLDNTLIWVMADNGRPFPRAKTRLHDSGMQTGLVAHWPLGIKQSGASESLVSAIDLAPTILEVANIQPPPSMQGVSLQPLFENKDAQVRRYAFSEHNWHDYEAHGRSLRDG